MRRPGLLLLPPLLLGCPQDISGPDPKDTPAPAPVEHRPVVQPWPEQGRLTGRDLLPGGSLNLSIRITDFSALLGKSTPPWLELLDPTTPMTATLGRPLADGGLHHRIAGRLKAHADWRALLPESTCSPLGVSRCFSIADARVYLKVADAAVVLDVFSHGTPAPEIVVDAIGFASDTDAPQTSAASADVRVENDALHMRLRWGATLGIPTRSDAAPSWSALCEGAAACLRTGPWPDVAAVVGRYETTAAALARVREQAPPMTLGFIDAALEGLGEIVFAGGRLEHDGTFIAFARLPTARVNFVASLLPYLDLQPQTSTVAGNTDVTWAPLPRGGFLLALDEGEQPQLGWVVFASTPDRFAWLLDAPRTQAQTPAAALMVSRLGLLEALLPLRWRPYLRPHRESALTLRLDVTDTELTAGAVVRADEGR